MAAAPRNREIEEAEIVAIRTLNILNLEMDKGMLTRFMDTSSLRAELEDLKERWSRQIRLKAAELIVKLDAKAKQVEESAIPANVRALKNLTDQILSAQTQTHQLLLWLQGKATDLASKQTAHVTTSSSADTHIQAIKSLINELQTEMKTHCDDITKAVAQTISMQLDERARMLNDQNTRIKQLETQYFDLDNQYKADSHQFSVSSQTLQRRVEELEERLVQASREAEDKCRQYEESIAIAENDLADAYDIIETLKEGNTAYLRELEELRQRPADFQSQIEHHNNQTSKLIETLKQREDEVLQLSTKLEEVTKLQFADKEEQQSKFTEYADRIVDQEKALADRDAKIADLTMKINSMEEKQNDMESNTIPGYEATVFTHEKRIKDLKEELEMKEEEITHAEDRIEQLTAEVAKMMSEIEMLRLGKSKLEVSDQSRSAELERRTAKLNETVALLEEKERMIASIKKQWAEEESDWKAKLDGKERAVSTELDEKMNSLVNKEKELAVQENWIAQQRTWIKSEAKKVTDFNQTLTAKGKDMVAWHSKAAQASKVLISRMRQLDQHLSRINDNLSKKGLPLIDLSRDEELVSTKAFIRGEAPSADDIKRLPNLDPQPSEPTSESMRGVQDYQKSPPESTED